ncbi:hypothetical protein MRX96_056270 [Rhipicephalus microplus]
MSQDPEMDREEFQEWGQVAPAAVWEEELGQVEWYQVALVVDLEALESAQKVQLASEAPGAQEVMDRQGIMFGEPDEQGEQEGGGDLIGFGPEHGQLDLFTLLVRQIFLAYGADPTHPSRNNDAI